MLRKILACCLLCAVAPVHAATSYAIDPAHSYVSSYAPVWTNEGPADAGVVSLPGEVVVPLAYYWRLDWQPVNHNISGSFEAEVIYSPFHPELSRLQLSNIKVVTDAPTAAGFSLPYQLSITGGGALHISNRVCDDDGFYSPGYASCSGGNIGPVTTHSGTFGAGQIAMTGGKPPDLMLTSLTRSAEMPPAVTDYSPVAGAYAYSIQATAVPEPGSGLMMLGGLGVLALYLRRQTNRERQQAIC